MSAAPRLALIGTLDTKHAELRYLHERLVVYGADVTVIDVGIFEPGEGLRPDVTADAVAIAAGSSLEALRAAADRGAAVSAMGIGAGAVLARLQTARRLHGVLAAGGSGNASIAAAAVRGLPIGLPKLIVTTIAAGDTRSYVAESDLTLMYPVVDVAGLNQLSRPILDNAAAAAVAMARAFASRVALQRRALAATMFGVTTTGVGSLRARLEDLGHEVLVFHASGHGGLTLESLIAAGHIEGVADVTTTELADDLVGGVCSAGSHRLEAAVSAGIPQVVSTGALDMVNFGPRATVPHHFRDRLFHEHNANVTLMRTSAAESRQLGRRLAGKLNASRVRSVLFVPTKGLSAISVPGGVFCDPEADDALRNGITEVLANPLVELRIVDTDINDPALAREMADELHQLVGS